MKLFECQPPSPVQESYDNISQRSEKKVGRCCFRPDNSQELRGSPIQIIENEDKGKKREAKTKDITATKIRKNTEADDSPARSMF